MRNALIAVLALCALAPPAALAANGPSPGVHVDPGSPAGKQYSFPIATTRGETSGRPSSASATAPPPFGAGVRPARAPATAPAPRPTASKRRASAGHPRSGHRRGGAHRGRGTRRAAAATPAAAPKPTTQTSGVGGSSWMPLTAGGVLVLLLGGGGGLALRRWA
jgi:hypothetical protein